MKWIGQHIWDYVTKFRNDIYLEDISTGTIASGGNLGLDSNNKIVKSANPAGTIDLTSEVTGVLPVANGGSGASSLNDNSILTGTGGSPITAETNFTYTGTALSVDAVTSTFLNATSANVYIQNTGNNANGGILSLYNTRGGGAGSANDNAGMIRFYAQDDNSDQHEVAKIEGAISSVTNNSETGKLQFKVASYDGEISDNTVGLTIQSGNAEDEVDVNIGSGTTSLTTIAGDLDIDGDKITTAGNIEIETGGSGNITLDSAGDIALEVSNNFTADAAAYTFSSDGSNRPSFVIQNTEDDATGPSFTISNIRDGNGLTDGDSLGTINFFGHDAVGGSEGYAMIQGVANETAHGDECGTLNFYVANNGALKEGIIIAADSGTASEVDVTIGSGAASSTSVVCTLNANAWGFLGGTANALITDDGDGTVTS